MDHHRPVPSRRPKRDHDRGRPPVSLDCSDRALGPGHHAVGNGPSHLPGAGSGLRRPGEHALEQCNAMKPPYRNAIARASGFTLLEVLIATVAFAIVLAAINAVFYGALRLRNQTVGTLDEAATLQHALAMIYRDLANVVVPGGTLSGTLQTTPT